MNNISTIIAIRDQLLEEFKEWIEPALNMDVINAGQCSHTYCISVIANYDDATTVKES